MPSIDPGFVPLLRVAFERAGLPDNLLSDDGDINVRALVGMVVQEVEIRTAYTPPRTISIRASSDARRPDPPPQGAPRPSPSVARKLQPTVEVRTDYGSFTLKPYGDPGPVIWRRNIAVLGASAAGLLLGVVLLGFFVGRLTAPGPGRKAKLASGALQLPARSVGGPLFGVSASAGGASSTSSPSGSGSASGGSSSTAPAL